VITTLWQSTRNWWRRLTSMRTALVLLFLLAVAAVPGSLLPQRPLNPDRTASYIKSHGGWGRFLNHIGMFDVFGSPWFAAIYLLLFVSLVGCIIPRIRQHARNVVRQPIPAPKNLDRLPESGSFEIADAPSAYATAARSALGRRWRVVQREDADGAVVLSAEKGYSRETGNLLFHTALLAALVLIAVGRLYSYQASNVVVQGQGFCNTGVVYDSWKPGRFAAEGKIHPGPFCIDSLDKFTATYSADGEPTKFVADITYSPSVDSASKSARISVNHPLRLEGDRIYLLNHGFAPQLTVHMPDGSIRRDTEPFIASDASTLLSEGAYQLYAKQGANKDVGIEGFFAPTPAADAAGVITSISPQVNNPVLGVFVYTGTLNKNNVPKSVYSLDKTNLKQIGAVNLVIGQTKTFPNGVSVTFDGWVPWVTLQISHDPAQGYLLIAAVAMVVGLLGSLGVRRRRIWLRITPSAAADEASPTVVSVGGLARSDSGNFSTEFSALLRRLQDVGTPTGAYQSSLHISLDSTAPAGRE
jgi:cytochrome c biogenesis protein